MTSTNLTKKIEALEEKRKKLQTQVKNLETKAKSEERKKENTRKFTLGAALLKLAETDYRVHFILTLCFDEAKKARPRAFENAVLPPKPPKPAMLNND